MFFSSFITYLAIGVIFYPFAFLPSAFATSTTSPNSCEFLHSSSLCYPLLNSYYISISNQSLCQNDIEQISNQTLPILLSLVSSKCQLILAPFLCNFFYPKCNDTSTDSIYSVFPCKEECENFYSTNSSCTLNDLDIIFPLTQSIPLLKDIFNCSNYNTTSDICNNNITTTPSSPLTLPVLSRCETYHGSVCRDYINFPIYFGPGIEPQDINENRLAPLAGANVIVSAQCFPALMKYSCSQAFLPCDNTVISQAFNWNEINPLFNQSKQAVFPNLPCQSLCQEYAIACETDLPFLANIDPQLYPTCISQGQLFGNITQACDNTLSGILDWPLNHTIFYQSKNQEITLTTTCNSFSNASASIFSGCIYPLVDARNISYIGVIRSQYPNSPCELPTSPAYIVSQQTWEMTERVTWLSVPVCILLIFVVITWVIFPAKRKQQYILMFCIPFLLWHLTNAFAFAAGQGDLVKMMRRSNNIEPAVGFNGPPNYCTYQGFATFLFGLQSISWWLIIALDLYMKTVLEKKFTSNEEKKKSIIYHSCAWFIPILLTSIYLAVGGDFGAAQVGTTGFCFFGEQSTDLQQYLLFFIPMGLACLIGGILMSFVILKIRKAIIASFQFHYHDVPSPSRERTSSTSAAVLAAKKKQDAKIRNLIMRPLLFVTVMLVLFVWMVAYRLEFQVLKSEIEGVVPTWINCLQTSLGNLTKCGVEPPHPFPESVYIGLHFYLPFTGLIFFLLWGTMEDNWYLWYGFLTGKGRNYAKPSVAAPTPMKLGREKNKEQKVRGSTKSLSDSARSLRSLSGSNSGTNPPELEIAELDPLKKRILLSSIVQETSEEQTNSNDGSPLNPTTSSSAASTAILCVSQESSDNTPLPSPLLHPFRSVSLVRDSSGENTSQLPSPSSQLHSFRKVSDDLLSTFRKVSDDLTTPQNNSREDSMSNQV